MHLAGAHVAGLDQVAQHLVGARARGRQVDVRGVAGGRLEQAGQQRRFGEVDVAHGLAEVELRGRLHPEGAAAQVGAIQVHLQDLRLGEARLQQEGEECLLDLANERALVGQEQVLGQLLGDGRAALHHLVGARVLDQRAERAEDVDAEVLEEPAVLGGQRRLDQVIGDLLQRHGVVVQDAAPADLGAVAVHERDGVAAGRDAGLVELGEGGDGDRVEHRKAADGERQPFRDKLGRARASSRSGGSGRRSWRRRRSGPSRSPRSTPGSNRCRHRARASRSSACGRRF